MKDQNHFFFGIDVLVTSNISVVIIIYLFAVAVFEEKKNI